MTDVRPAEEPNDPQLVAAVLGGDVDSFEALISRYQPRVFATVRRYARRESEVEDIVQEVFLKAFRKLGSYRGEAPFEHWLMRLTVRTCYDALRSHQRNREHNFTDFSPEDGEWVERFGRVTDESRQNAAEAKEIVDRILEHLSPAARMVITLMEIEERSVKEVSRLTGWSASLVKVRAFRARSEMRKWLAKLTKQRKL